MNPIYPKPVISGMLPDVLHKGLTTVFCGLNPGLQAAKTGHHFAGRNNRFWRVLHLAGYTPELLAPEDDCKLLLYGCGLTTAVERPTARADELVRHEFVMASVKLRKKIEINRPGCIAFLGKAAYVAISGQNKVGWGIQSKKFGGATVWVLPNPSGLNRSFGLEDLVLHYRQLRLTVK